MADLKVKVGIDKSGFTTGLASMENSVKGFGNKVGGILAGAFAFDKIIQGFSTAIEKGDQLQDIAEKFGISASKLQLLGNAASVFGSGVEAVSAGLNKLSLAQQKAISGDEGLISTFKEVGITLQDLEKLTAEDVFLRISDSFSSGANEGRQFIIVNELLGKAQTDLIKVMNQGSAAIIEQGSSMGVWSDETIAKLSAASDAIKTFQNTMTIAFGTLAQIAMPLIEVFQDLAQFTTMLTSAAGSAITGDFAGASEITKEAGKIKIRRDQEEARQERLKRQAGRGFDSDGSGAGSATADKAFEKSEQAAARHELKLIEAQISGKEEAEKMKQAIEEKYAQRSLERNQKLGQDKASETDDRAGRLAIENKSRGNAADFDPRAALMDRYGLGKQASDIPSSTEAKPIQPVKLENPPNLQGIMDKLDRLIANAGVFS
jgi:hypothetical protein